MEWLLIALISIVAVSILFGIFYCSTVVKRQFSTEIQKVVEKNTADFSRVYDKLTESSAFQTHLQQLLMTQQQFQQGLKEQFESHQFKNLKSLQETIIQSMSEIRQQVTSTLFQQTQLLSERVEKLTQETQTRLKEISGQVERRLFEGFEKTQATFTDVVKRLTMIDEAQKRISELSTNVMSLQEILADKKSRGALGEVQLSALIQNMIPAQHVSFQHELSNHTRVDCLLSLPEPTGNVSIDAKFPLESYRQLQNSELPASERQKWITRFRQDIRKHIRDIADKYIIPGETADGAVMFIPSEVIFSDIHAYHGEVVEEAYRLRVWLASPTTLMAILTTARAVLKDAATRKQLHLIQAHLVALGKDFERFQKRMENLAQHIAKAHEDVEQVHTSSRKISARFSQIEKVEMQVETQSVALLSEDLT